MYTSKEKLIMKVSGAVLLGCVALYNWAHGELKYLEGRADQREELTNELEDILEEYPFGTGEED